MNLDLTGMKFGRWTVLSFAGAENGKKRWLCQCDCGTVREVLASRLKNSRSRSCGCLQRDIASQQLIDLTGQRFDRLLVISLFETRKKRSYWNCECDCGTKKVVAGYLLKSKQIKSCGCLYHETNLQRVGDKNGNYKPHLPEDYRDKHRLKPKYANFVKSVFERDNYTCVACSIHGGTKLNAHHKNGWHWCKERRLDLTNAATLCEACHTDFHRQYGRRNNTDAQFVEWLAARKDFKVEE